jgi:uncharacterized membrane protein YfcA
MILGAITLGVIIGLSLGALGGGGSILTVPALVFVLGLTAQQATAGSLIIVGVTAAIASIGHARAGNTRWGKGTVLAVVGIPASLLGSHLNRDVQPDVLLLAFSALMIIAALGMLLRAQTTAPDVTRNSQSTANSHDQQSALNHGTTLTSNRAVTTVPALGTAARIVAAGLGIGFLTGFLGVGGGFIIVPVLVVLLRYDMPVAVGTSLLVIALNSAVALAARLGHGGLIWHIVLPFTLAAVAGSLAGKKVADRIDAASLTRAFAVLLLAVAVYVGIQAAIGTS